MTYHDEVYSLTYMLRTKFIAKYIIAFFQDSIIKTAFQVKSLDTDINVSPFTFTWKLITGKVPLAVCPTWRRIQ